MHAKHYVFIYDMYVCMYTVGYMHSARSNSGDDATKEPKWRASCNACAGRKEEAGPRHGIRVERFKGLGFLVYFGGCGPKGFNEVKTT